MDIEREVASHESLVYVEKHTMASHSATIRCAHFNPSASLLATGGDDHSIHIWNCQSGALEFQIVGHSPALSALWTSDPEVLIVGFEDNLLISVVISYEQVRLSINSLLQADWLYGPTYMTEYTYGIRCISGPINSRHQLPY